MRIFASAKSVRIGICQAEVFAFVLTSIFGRGRPMKTTTSESRIVKSKFSRFAKRKPPIFATLIFASDLRLVDLRRRRQDRDLSSRISCAPAHSAKCSTVVAASFGDQFSRFRTSDWVGKERQDRGLSGQDFCVLQTSESLPICGFFDLRFRRPSRVVVCPRNSRHERGHQ